jgi:hypothetical protein
MRRYYFHVWDGRQLRKDKRGVELERLEEAVEEVEATMKQLGETGEDLSRYVVEVVSDDGSKTYINGRSVLNPPDRRPTWRDGADGRRACDSPKLAARRSRSAWKS